MTTSDKIFEESLSWLMKQNEGLSKQEQFEFSLWIKNEEHKKEYEKNKNIFFSYNILGESDKDEIKKDIKKDKSIELFRKKVLPLAASFIFLIISLAVFNYFDSSKLIYENSFNTTNLAQTNIKLPDNSIIDLDVKTKVHVQYYKNRRFVNLKEGKAIFSVKRDENRVFQIKSGKNQIEVLGTKFEVVNLDEVTTVNVIEGKVRVSHFYNENKKAKNLRVLTKEQSFSVNENGKVLSFSNKETRNIANWKKGILKFQKATLKELLNEFYRYHEYEVKFENYELSQLNISGVFKIDEFDELLESLPEIYPIDIKKENKKIYISQKI